MRALSIEDLRTVVALDRLCFKDEWSDDLWLSYLQKEQRYCVFLIEHEGHGVGYALYSYLFEEAELLRIGVLPEYRGLGLSSRAMMRHIQVLADKGVHTLMLEVRASNAPAKALYRTLGFTLDGFRKGYYPASGDLPKEDALLMSLKFTGSSQ